MKLIPKWLEGVDLLKLREYVVEDGGDGWTIWKPDKFTAMGFKADDLPTKTHESGTGKHEITLDGERQEQVTGVWNLMFMTTLAAHLGVGYMPCLGRGKQARVIRDAVLPALDQLVAPRKETNNEKQH